MLQITCLYATINSEIQRQSLGQGEIPYRRYSPRPAQVADSVKFRNRQYSLDERRTRKFLNTCSSPWKKFQGLFSL